MATFAVGDVHGNYEALHDLLDIQGDRLCGNHDDWMLRTRRDFRTHTWVLATDAFVTIQSYSPSAAERSLRRSQPPVGRTTAATTPCRMASSSTPCPHHTWIGSNVYASATTPRTVSVRTAASTLRSATCPSRRGIRCSGAEPISRAVRRTGHHRLRPSQQRAADQGRLADAGHLGTNDRDRHNRAWRRGAILRRAMALLSCCAR